jgi:hypothetical protein
MKKGRGELTKELIKNDIKYNLEKIEELKLRIKYHKTNLKKLKKDENKGRDTGKNN